MGGTARDISALKRCRQLPPITRAGLPGYNYVILGSMLGGKIIVKRLRTVLGPDASFLFYGDGIDRFEDLWASFCADLKENREHDVQEIDGLLYLPGRTPDRLQRALRVPALSAGWKGSLESLAVAEEKHDQGGNAGVPPSSAPSPGNR